MRLIASLYIILTSMWSVTSYKSFLPRHCSAALRRSLISIIKSSKNVITLEPPKDISSFNPIFATDPVQLQSMISLQGLKEIIGRSLFQNASVIQQKSYLPIFSGKDVIVGAETGSGKTLAYFLPLIDRYLGNKISASVENQSPSSWEEAADKLNPSLGPQFGIILAPSGPLCDQVMQMIQPLASQLKEAGHSIKLSRWSDTIYDRKDLPLLSIIVCTPKTLADVLRGTSHFEPSHPFRSLAFVVLDEADMLLDGSYLSDVERVLDNVRLVRRTMIQEGLVKINDRPVQYVLSAATIPTMGLKSIDRYAKKAFPHAVYIRSDHMHHHHPSIRQQFIQFPEQALLTPQHAREVMTRLYQLHSKAEGEPVDSSWASALDYSVMIFLNTAANAQAFANLLREQGYDCLEMHALLDKGDRDSNLQDFRDNKVRLLVCTDACARGFDMPQVRRVVQGEFALNVVQHLHRIGRSSRGGVQGEALNFYSQQAEALVQSIIGAADLDEEVPQEEETMEKSSIEKSFSRRRGFRQKIKRAQKGNSDA